MVYRITTVCTAQEEIRVRGLLLHALTEIPALLLQSLHSEDTAAGGHIEVRADVLAAPGNESKLEQIVSRISMEKSVSLVRWAIPAGALE